MADTHEGVVVLGAGLTGLSFAYHYDPATPIYEREAEVGGLVRTVTARDCHFDLAPHLLHLRSDYARKLVFEDLGLDAQEIVRKARIYYDNRIIPYPFELNLYPLSEQVREDCLRGLEKLSPLDREDEQAMRSGSYKEYAMKAFGDGICDHYLLPYNRKIWDTDPGDMTCEWMRFLPTADVEKIRQNATAPSDDAFGYNTSFYYPKRDGIRELPESFAAKLSNIHLEKEVSRIETATRTVHFSDGSTVNYEKLVSTLPLKRLVELSDLPDAAKEAAQQLVFTTVYTINIVIRGSVPEGVHWMYFPDTNLRFYRMSFPKNFFPRATPGDEQILAVEVGRRDDGLTWEEIVPIVEKQAMALDIFDVKEHLFTHCEKLPVAYCIYDRNRTPTVEALSKELQSRDVYSTGRYGQWEYSALEDAIMHGKTLAETFGAMV